MHGSHVYHSGRNNAYMANAWRKVVPFLVSKNASSQLCAAAARGRYGCFSFASHSFKTAKAVKRPLSIATAAATVCETAPAAAKQSHGSTIISARRARIGKDEHDTTESCEHRDAGGTSQARGVRSAAQRRHRSTYNNEPTPAGPLQRHPPAPVAGERRAGLGFGRVRICRK